ncbi:UMP-CMP kinase [Plasmodium gonderi]|uniref:UMP-CMP kinase n=1 Tax=Plasmodium gonderi TaxID=77519 RepID=A0A1Y1JCX7_PLAGO|nr:UMP-CMP kinase [Plasmodium gonderi]GAW79067.1 UMP-CMP kinase [Plasmodium gonderi]
MNHKTVYAAFFFTIVANFSKIFVDEFVLLKNKKVTSLSLCRTGAYYRTGERGLYKTIHQKRRITRNIFFKLNLPGGKTHLYRKHVVERNFFANNTFTMSKDQPFIFMLGGPGSGKGTQCKLIQEKFNFVHISAGDCLREYLTKCEKGEVDTKHQTIVEDCINNGNIVPVHITLELMKIKMKNEIEKRKKQEEEKESDPEKMPEHVGKKSFSFDALDENVKLKNANMEHCHDKLRYENCIYESKQVQEILKKNKFEQKAKYKFIIDGFPRNYDNFEGWMNVIGNYAYVHLCLFLYCDEDTMIKRCMNRGLMCGRVDDNMDTLRKRFETHKNGCMPIINIFINESKCIFINANKNIEDVWKDIQYVFTNM